MSENSLVLPMMNQRILVDTPLGMYSGILRRTDRSRHRGVGNLLPETRESWLLVKSWFTIKRSI
jgi:hypothetical protein